MNTSIELRETIVEPSETFFISVFSFVAVLIIVGSIISLIFIVSIINDSALQSVSSLLSCNSCVSGLFYFAFQTFYVILAFYPLPNYRQNSRLCHIIGYMYSVTCCCISWSHAVLASSRFCYSLFPQYRWLLSYTFAWCLIAIHWALTFILPFPFIFFNAYQYQHESRICILDTRQTSTSLAGVILFYNIPFTSVIVLYVLVWRHARRSSNAALSSTKRNLAIMRHILTLVIIDIICGHPYMALILLDHLGRATKEWYLSVSVFITLSVTTNMCAIFIFNRQLRKRFCSKWPFWRTPQSSSDVAASPTVQMRTSLYLVMVSNILPGLAKSPTKGEISTTEK